VEPMKRTRRWRSLKRRGAAVADVALLPVAMALLAPSGADAKTSVNTFEVKSYLATLSHMKRVDTNVGRVLGP